MPVEVNEKALLENYELVEGDKGISGGYCSEILRVKKKGVVGGPSLVAKKVGWESG